MNASGNKLSGPLKRALVIAGVCSALVTVPILVIAQQDETSDDVGTDTTLTPRDSTIAPRAASALLLSVAKAGANWVAVGQRGDVLLSSDGKAWSQVKVPVDATLIRVRFIDDQNGWAVGYDGTVLSTNDGGKNWSLAQFDAAWGKPYFDVLFTDPQNGLLVGANGALKRSNDGGQTWTAIESDVLADTPNLYNLIKLGNGNLLIAGERGFLITSNDGGTTWKQLKSPYSGSYFGAVPLGADGVVVFGLRGNAFYAADLSKAAPLSAKDLDALRAAALNPEAAASGGNPVTAVAGWIRLASDDTESLFGGSVTDDGRALLFGANGRVMEVDTSAGALKRIPVGADINMNMGLLAGNDVITVGTSGVKRLALAH